MQTNDEEVSDASDVSGASKEELIEEVVEKFMEEVCQISPADIVQQVGLQRYACNGSPGETSCNGTVLGHNLGSSNHAPCHHSD